MDNTKKQLEAKIITLGDSHVGKTSLIVQFIDNKFTANYLSTIGFQIPNPQSRYDFLFNIIN